jgi:hypothetical protein
MTIFARGAAPLTTGRPFFMAPYHGISAATGRNARR